MRADAQLDYAIFQLTPTRTRCELHIHAKGVTYKLASGLLKPFVSHLKAAEEQLAKGGYSLCLEPSDPSRASWFTKRTMERFVRFVSTPEVLERVSSVEAELLELEETTRQQTAETHETGTLGQVDNLSKAATSQLCPGGKLTGTAASDKGLKGLSDVVENGSEESSKQRLLRALDARRVMLQKEQGMAFARALAAGFDLENMDDLVLFAECFGADRLRDACVKFVALCKKRQESGLGLEDLELMAADSVQADTLYMGVVGGNAIGLGWPHIEANGQELPHSPGVYNGGRQVVGEDSAEKPCEGLTQFGHSPMTASGDGESLPAVVKGQPIMAAWQGQPHNQFMPGVPPYAGMHPGMASHFDSSFGFTGPTRPGQMGLAYPHYLGGSHMPAPYADGNGWQPLSFLSPQYWPAHQASDPTDGSQPWTSHQQSVPSSREREKRESNRFDADDMQLNEEDVSSDLSGRPAIRSSSPRRRSSSPMKKIQIGRNGGSKRSGMLVIRNINYIAPKAKQQDSEDDNNSENSDSWSDDSEEEEILEGGAETLRTSIEDAVEAVEGKYHPNHDGKRKHPKKNKKLKKKAASNYSRHQRDSNGIDVEADDEEPMKHTDEKKEYVWVINRRESGADEISEVFPEEGLASGVVVQSQGSFDPASESAHAEKRSLLDAEIRSVSDDTIPLSQNSRDRATDSQLVDMFKQEQHVGSKQVPIVDDSHMILGGGSSVIRTGNDDSHMILGGGSSVIRTGNALLEQTHDFSIKRGVDPQAAKALPDDSFILLDRSEGREASNEDWSASLNLEAEMPLDQNHEPASEPNSFEPDDLVMVPDRDQDTHKGVWNNHGDLTMEVAAANFLSNGKRDENNDVAENGDVQEQEVESKPAESLQRKLSEKNAKAKAMKDMLERRKSPGGSRLGRPNPLAEAQLRAEKLRLYKSGLQKSKQEREEEERKRLEDLRTQRQQRIAARSNPSGTSQFSPSSIRGTRTPPPITIKSSPKVPDKVSPLSSSVSQERLANGSKLARNISNCTKPTQSSITRSVSSLTEFHRESKKLTSAVRASTGSQLLSPNVKTERHTELNTSGKSNDRAEEKAVKVKVGRIDGKIGRSNSGLTEESFGRTESGRINEKIGRTESGRTDDLSEGGRILVKAMPIATRATKLVVAPGGPALHSESPRSPIVDGDVPKKTLKFQPERIDKLASQVKSPRGPFIDSKVLKKTATAPVKATAQKKTNFAPKASDVDTLNTEPALLHASQMVPLSEYSESPVKVSDSEASSPVEAQNSLLTGHGSKHESHVLTVASHENGLSKPDLAVIVVEESKLGASQIGSPLEAGSIIKSELRQSNVETCCPVVEENNFLGDCVPLMEDSSHSPAERDVFTSERHLTEEYSTPLALSSEYATSLLVKPSPNSLTTQQPSTMDLSGNDESRTRSRKKSGDSKAKGLKRLLLLGRKSGRSSTHNMVDVLSEGEEEDLCSSNGKNMGINLYDGLDTSNQVVSEGDVGLLNSTSKGSRSIFSFSTFRGSKSSVKAQ